MQASIASPLSARRRRLGLVEGRRQPRLHDRLRRQWPWRSHNYYKLDWHGQQMLNNGRDYLEKQLAAHPRHDPRPARLRGLRALRIRLRRLVRPAQHSLVAPQTISSSEGLSFTGLAMLHANDARTADLAKLLESKVKEQGDLASWPSTYKPCFSIWNTTTACRAPPSACASFPTPMRKVRCCPKLRSG